MRTAVTLGFCAGILILGLGWSALWLVALPLEVFIIYTLLTTLQELGHLVAGWRVGYRFKSLRVGRIKVVATERGLHLQLVAESIWGGAVEPREGQSRTSNLGEIVFAAGGLLFSLLIRLLSAAAILATKGGELTIQWHLSLVSIIAAYQFCLDVVVRRSQTAWTDGGRIAYWLRRNANNEAIEAYKAMHADAKSGQRPRECSIGHGALALGNTKWQRIWSTRNLDRAAIEL